ncbi:MAG: EAL domain-containing protein [Telluria sp.]|nr:EAL domain-containing protein [Telluria sp.]
MPAHILASALPQHEAAELYRLMVEDVKECAVFLMDPHGIITVWNKAAETMKGYPAEEAIGSHLSLLYTDEDKARGHPEHNLRMAAEHGFYSEEAWRKRKDGSLFWAHLALTALRGDGGELLGFSKITLDLTHHKLLEQCEREKKEIDLILQAAGSGTWKWNILTNQVDVSIHLFELLGHAGAKRMLDFDSWLMFVAPEDRPALREQLHAVRDDSARAPLEMEMRFVRKDGQPQWFFMRANWHYESEVKPLVLMGACVDIESLKTAEQEKENLYRELNRQTSRFANILEQMPSGVLLADVPSGKLTYQNRAAQAIFGCPLDAMGNYPDCADFRFFNARGEPVRPQDMPLARTVSGQAGSQTEELFYERPDGARLHLAVTTAAIVDNDGEARLAVAVMHDVTKLKEAQLQAATEKERAQVTLAAVTDGVVTTDRRGTVASMNPAAQRLLGVSGEQACGRPFSEVAQVDDALSVQALMDAVARCQAERRVIADLPHLTLQTPDGKRHSVESAVAPVALEDGELIGAVLVFHDVTESKRLMRRLGFEASHDALTGLVNRREFETRLQRTLEHSQHPGATSSALLYMDLDQFKIVNDTCGHPAGDDLLKQLAQSYAEHVRERDTLARIGGDEFALIVEHCTIEEAMAVAHKILEATRNFRYPCKGRVFQLGVSIGLTPIDVNTVSVEEALRRADHACYTAKDRGRNQVYVHYKGDLDFAQRRSDMHWVTRLSHAFENEQLQLYCQPIVALGGDSESEHYEILLRLRNGRSGPVGPGSFLPAAERYDVIHKIDRWVLNRTLAWLAQDPEHTARLGMCSINLSRRSLADQGFHTFAADLIDQYDVPAEKLCFEITENGAIADMQKTIAFIETLATRGCRFALDDFGTGMTSFSYLKQLPVDFIKIDGSFIQMMSSSEVDFEMVRFTNDISHKMGRKTIAEYVSEPAILKNLERIGVDFAQGYWVGKPRPLTP